MLRSVYCFACTLILYKVCQGSTVDKVEPHKGSLEGGTRLTIHGSGFSSYEFKFGQNDESTNGNEVYLVGESGSIFICTVDTFASTEDQIVCSTPRFMVEENYYVKVIVDSVPVPDSNLCGDNPTSSNCRFESLVGNTPTIETITPQSGTPGSLITIRGKIMTDRYGSDTISSTNGNLERIQRVYVGDTHCDLMNGNILYKLALDDKESDTGTLTCKIKGAYIGCHNASFIIDGPYGRSMPSREMYRVSRNGQLYMYQLYAYITSITSESTSAGGLTLTINGNFLKDETSPSSYVATKVYVGDTKCDVTKVSVDYVECSLATDPQDSATKYAGNRGVKFEYWTLIIPPTINDVLTMTSSDPGYGFIILDETYYHDDDDALENFYSRMTTYFIPPHTGEYQFHLKAVDSAILFIDGVAEVTSTGEWAYSQRKELVKLERVLLEIAHASTTLDSLVHVKVKFFDTPFTSEMTSKAEQEKQTIRVTTTIHQEVQELAFDSFVPQPHREEVQTVIIDTNGEFRFGLFGVYTISLTTEMDEATIADAVNALPIFGIGEYLEVIKISTIELSQVEFKFTFVSRRGDFPPIEVVQVAGGSSVSYDISYDVTEDIKGIPDMDMIALSIEGTVSEPFSVSSLSASTLSIAINSMLEVKCPAEFDSHSVFYESYESQSAQSFFYDNESHSSLSMATMAEDPVFEPFCGKHCLKNPDWLYVKKSDELGIMLSSYNMLCFAYKGLLQNSIGLQYSTKQATDDEKVSHQTIFPHAYYIDPDTFSPETWYYTCLDMFAIAMAEHPDDTDHMLEKVWVTRENNGHDIYIDSTSIGKNSTISDTDISKLRRPAAKPNGVFIDEVTVDSLGNNQYTVTLKSFDCGPAFSLIELANGVTTSGSTASPSTAATMTLSNGVSGSLHISRSSFDSTNDCGIIDVTYDGDTRENIDVAKDADSIKRELETLDGIGSLLVEKSCSGANLDLDVTFLTLPGDRPEMKVAPHNSDCTTASASIITKNDGGLFYDPLPGDMLSTVHSKLQARVYINDIPVACNGDCSVVLDAAQWPTSDTGAAHHDDDVVLQYTITSISPTAGSLYGGTELRVAGTGFQYGISVTINSVQCAVISVQYNQILCVTPASSSSGSYDVVVQQGDATHIHHSSYTYDVTLTATVTSVSPTSISVQGGTLTISGSSFDTTPGAVHVGTKQATVIFWSDTSIIVETGPVEPGNMEIRVQSKSGFAMESGLFPTVLVDLILTNVYPRQGSVKGGTKLTITGSGFGTTHLDVTVGEFACDIHSVTSTQIVCQIENTGKVHHVNSKGYHSVFPAFGDPQLIIHEGDTVEWSWETPKFVHSATFSIFEVDNPSSTTRKSEGFNSGTLSKNGQYKVQFMEAGTFYYYSSYVYSPSTTKHYRGTITVGRRASFVGEVSVQVYGIAALHNVEGSLNPSDSSSCQSVTSGKLNCLDPLPSGDDPSKFNFAFWTCSTPVIYYLDQTKGTILTEVTMTGEGLSTINCQNEITFGSLACTATSSSDTSVTCSLAKSGTPKLGVPHQASIRIGNRGYALIAIHSVDDRSFVLLPCIETIHPKHGSLAGAAVVTIIGFGFGDSPTVAVGGNTCNIISSSNSEIVCETPSSLTQGEKEVTVHVNANDIPVQPLCETSDRKCRYTYASHLTPSVINISPNIMGGTGGTDFTITGTKFGTSVSDITVLIGGNSATVTSALDKVLEGTIVNVPVGINDLVVKIKDYGKASVSLTVNGDSVITSVSPLSGSTNGQQQITIKGNGFVESLTVVKLDDADCSIISVTLAEIVCRTPAHSAGSADLTVTSNAVSYPHQQFFYKADSTPTVVSVSLTSELPSKTLTITGLNFGGGSVTVLLGGIACIVTSCSNTQIECTLGDHGTGRVPVYVHVSGVGASNTDVMFEYQLTLSTISPPQGGTGGGQRLTFTGTGFTATASAKVCSQTCIHISATSTEYVCKTPAASAQTCDVDITVNGLTKTLLMAYTYDSNLTPVLTSVLPTRGGTEGGTLTTVSGKGFRSVLSDVDVTIDGVKCDLITVTDTEVQCMTGPHDGSIQTKVEVEVRSNGIAKEKTSGAADFDYVDLWSSSYTWGGGSPPKEGDNVTIPTGMTMLLDTNPPKLDILLIDGGQVIFDEKDVELKANNIIITNRGLLQVGTEAEPFQHKAIITLHGRQNSKELPIHGTKSLAVRSGTLDLHGHPVLHTWTRLANTASAGTNTITLTHPVQWQAGDEVVIAATGYHPAQNENENEKKVIMAISDDKRTLTLDTYFTIDHLGVAAQFGESISVEMRAEVGLLTHNVVVRGATNSGWEDESLDCGSGFNPGEFVTENCIPQFGHEKSTEIGCHILIRPPAKDSQWAIARLSFVEITHAGQAFHPGRYPVHFHLNGDMSESYIRGCSIHTTFNRAINLHGVHNTVVENTVAYDIKGGAIFLEDGTETGNTFQHNLAIFVQSSTSLQNDDITPAAFWVTNSDNTYQHNHVAGGTHFGFWYRMSSPPDGPSTTEVEAQFPFAEFCNNTVHSVGLYGLLNSPVFSDTRMKKFQDLTTWHNEKGAVNTIGGAVEFDELTSVHNAKAGYEEQSVINPPGNTDDSHMLINSIIVGKTTVIPNNVHGCSEGGLVLPYLSSFSIRNVTFVNFADAGCAALRWTGVAGDCEYCCGGNTYNTEQITFVNAPHKAIFKEEWEGVLKDKDGTLINLNWTVIPTTPSLPTHCESASAFSIGKPASACPPQYKFIKFAFKNLVPQTLEDGDIQIKNQYGTSSVVHRKMGLTQKKCWTCNLIEGETYSLIFEKALTLNCISLTGVFYDIGASDHIIMRLKFAKMPDRLSIDDGKTFIYNTAGGLNFETAKNGAWEWINANSEINILASGKTDPVPSTYPVDIQWNLIIYSCYSPDCAPNPAEPPQ